MKPIDPCIHPDLVPAGSRAVVMAAHQQEIYQPLPTVQTPSGCVITRWELTDAERRLIFDGADVFIAIHTFNQPQQPIQVVIGSGTQIDWRDN